MTRLISALMRLEFIPDEDVRGESFFAHARCPGKPMVRVDIEDGEVHLLVFEDDVGNVLSWRATYSGAPPSVVIAAIETAVLP